MHYECEEMPYYINGKLYVPIQDDKGYDFKYAVYDKQGNKIQTTSLAEGEKVYQENRNGKYSIFSEEHRVTEQGNYSTVGLKDSIGKEVLSADYMLINGLASGTTNFSNGVVLVVLSEKKDEEGYEDKGSIVYEETRYYYGYADLDGNDTFSKELKQKSTDSHERAANKLHQDAEEVAETTQQAESADDNDPQTKYIGKIIDSDGYANVREEPSIDAKIVRTLQDGRYVHYYKVPGSNWYKVFSIDDEYYGYVHKSRVKFLYKDY